MEYANKIKSPAVVLYGEDEWVLANQLKKLKFCKEKINKKIKELVNEIKKLSEAILKLLRAMVLFCRT